MDELPPCPYTALGIPKDATLGSIKSAYRKLVLTCHPDKVKDESLKEQKAAEFHKIQSAYDLIGEQEGKEKYD
ncbi:heat shock protein DnaJ, partial [Patellaria atrata CBS 101060]